MNPHLLLAAGCLGLIEVLAPKRVVALFTRAAYRNADDAEPRDWFYTVARLEGALLVVVALVGLFTAARTPAEVDEPDATAVETSEDTTDAR